MQNELVIGQRPYRQQSTVPRESQPAIDEFHNVHNAMMAMQEERRELQYRLFEDYGLYYQITDALRIVEQRRLPRGGVFLIQNPNSISQCSNILFGRFFKLLAETSLFVIFNYIGMNGGAVKAKFLYIGTHFN